MTVVIPSPAGVLVNEVASSSGQQGPECPSSPLMGSPVGRDFSLLDSSSLLPSLLHPRGGSSAGEPALLGLASGASAATAAGLSATAAVAAEVWPNEDIDDASASIKPLMEGGQAPLSSGRHASYPPLARDFNKSSSGPTSITAVGSPEDAGQYNNFFCTALLPLGQRRVMSRLGPPSPNARTSQREPRMAFGGQQEMTLL